jgi:hypothetical protein
MALSAPSRTVILGSRVQRAPREMAHRQPDAQVGESSGLDIMI